MKGEKGIGGEGVVENENRQGTGKFLVSGFASEISSEFAIKKKLIVKWFGDPI